MRKLLTSTILAGMIATGASAYGNSNFGVSLKLGMANVSVEDESVSKPEFEVIFNYNKKDTYQNRFGYDVIFTGSNSDTSDGDGNLGYIFYSGAYKYSEKLLPYFTIGYGFVGGAETLSGIGLSAGVEYKITNRVNVSAEYKYINLDVTDANIAAVKLGYSF